MFLLYLFFQNAAAQLSPDTLFNNPENLIKQLYKEVTFSAGTSPNWDKVKSMFIHDAVIVLLTSRDASTIFNVEGFILDFITFIEKAKVRETGFEEKIILMQPLVFGDIANILVLYEAHICKRNYNS